MRVFFLSDLHLSDGKAVAARRFESFLRERPRGGDMLLLGGDIFDLFIGDKAFFRQKFSGVLGAIHEAARRGVQVHYLEGNHDFHLREVFHGTAGIHFHTDDFAVTAAGRRLWISHGDLIDPEDRGYRLLRIATRHPLFRLLVRLVPGALIDAIGNRSSKESRKYHSADKVDPANRERLRSLYLAFAVAKAGEGFQHVLVGHSHLPDQVEMGKAEYLNLGFSAEALCTPLSTRERPNSGCKAFLKTPLPCSIKIML